MHFVDSSITFVPAVLTTPEAIQAQINALNDERRDLYEERNQAIKDAYPNPIAPDRLLTHRLRAIEGELKQLEDSMRRLNARR